VGQPERADVARLLRRLAERVDDSSDAEQSDPHAKSDRHDPQQPARERREHVAQETDLHASDITVADRAAEVEPLSEDSETPNAIRLTADPDPSVRVAAFAVGEACRDLLRALAARDERTREVRRVEA
jgi:hypothetical protein